LSRIETVKTATAVTASMATTAADAVADVAGRVLGSMRSQRDPAKPHGKFSTSMVAIVDVLDAMHFAARNVITTGVETTATSVEYK